MSVFVAVALDTAFAEPPMSAHPVAWMGRYLDRVGARIPSRPPGRAVATGGVAWLGGAIGAVTAGLLVDRAAARVPTPIRPLVRGTALWPLLSLRMLLDEVTGVETALADDLDVGRTALARIVSRDTAALSEAEVRAAALESLAENLSDSFVATLCWYAVAGLPGAAAHRFANTADATWGYRTPRWLHAGRVAARADDLANLVPARLTGLLLLPRPRTWYALRVESLGGSGPNAGWPMAALALRLRVRLAKRDHYELHADGADPTPLDVDRALSLVRRAALAATLLTAGVVAVRNVSPTTGGT